jgi:SAM-dependent methyltransferase
MMGGGSSKKVLDEVLDRNIATFNSAWSAREYSKDEGLWAIEAALVERHFPPAPADVLDIGCGAGRTTVGLQARGYRVVAVDLSTSLLAIARARFPDVDFRHMDARDLDFPDGRFDAAIFSYNGIDTLFPASCRVECFREVFRVLKPGGVFAFSTHNLIGAFFSGGFWYPRGYWNALRLLWAQRANPAAKDWYICYDDGGGGSLIQYSAPPRWTIDQLHAAGFDVIDLCGNDGDRRIEHIVWHAQHVNVVARRPAVP